MTAPLLAARPVPTTRRRLLAEVARLRREVAAARAAAHTDPLTGLLNRRGLHAHWPTADGVLALLDLDGFKPINDTHGHAAGDHLLTVLASRLRRHATVVARLGGDEFAAVLPTVAAADAVAASVADPIVLPGGPAVRVAASVGVTVCTTHLGDTLARADAAMYRAKRTRGGVAAYDPDLDHPPRLAVPAGVRIRDLPPLAASRS